MASKQLTFTLEKPARKSGGDRYTAEGRDDFTIYVPQELSRAGNAAPAPTLAVTITNEDAPASV